jgi:hypothetical protein
MMLPPGINASFTASLVYSEDVHSFPSPLNAVVPSLSSNIDAVEIGTVYKEYLTRIFIDLYTDTGSQDLTSEAHHRYFGLRYH